MHQARTVEGGVLLGPLDEPEAALEARVREQLAGWFGDAEIERWRYLRSYVVPYAQPSQSILRMAMLRLVYSGLSTVAPSNGSA